MDIVLLNFSGFNFQNLPSNLYIYTGLFLSEEDRKGLLATFPPKHANVYADHVTLCFKPTFEQAELVKRLEGQVLRLAVTGYGEDHKGQAISVKLPEMSDIGIQAKNKIPHITISCASGTSAVYSNELLERQGTQRSATYIIRAAMGVCAHTDRNHLPREMWKRRGL